MAQLEQQNDVIKTLVDEEGIRVVDLTEIGAIDPEIVSSIPEEITLKHKIVPISHDEGYLHVAMANPFDLLAQEAIRSVTNYEPRFCFTPENQINEWLDKLYLKTDIEEYSKSFKQGQPENVQDASVVTIDTLETTENDAPSIRYVNKILLNAIQERASDIHIEPQEKTLTVRFRIDGTLREIASVPKHLHAGIVSRIKILSSLDIAERRIPQDGRTNLNIFGRQVDIRTSTLPTINGEKVVMRILDKDLHSLNIADLGLDSHLQENFKQSLLEPHGMILVTGPTGSGKTTTLYSALNYLNSREKNIITVEDPVEYQMKRINQVQAKPDIGLTFAAGLRAILRQDPDIIMVGEIRDLETAEIAMRSALTGHLVFSTLHTNNSIATIMRLVDMGIDKYLICSSVNLIVAQRLIRRICFHCAEAYQPDDGALDRIPNGREQLANTLLRKGCGCAHCGGSGYWGRVAIFEFLPLTTELRELIIKDCSLDEIQAKALESGRESLLTNGLQKIKMGITTIDEILRVTSDIF